jgi:hypothetical protein
MLLVDGLLADAESIGDLLPRPTELAGSFDLQALETIRQLA